MLRNLLLLALCGVSSAAQVHQAGSLPRGWTATAERVQADAVFHNVMIGLKRSNAAALEGIALELSNPKHANYLQYPTYEEVGALVRPAAAHMAAVEQWIAAHGATVVVEHPHGDYVQIEATAAQLEAMAGGKFTTFVHGETGMRAHRMVDGVSVSDDVADAIETFSGFSTLPVLTKPRVTARKANEVCPVTLAAARATYNVTEPVSAVKNLSQPLLVQAIAQFEGQYVNDTDLAKYCKLFDPKSGSCTIDKYIGDKNDPAMPGFESMLDTEWISPMSYESTTWVYTYHSFDFCNNLLAFGSDVTGAATYPYVISISYGSQFIAVCDNASKQRFAQDVTKMAHMGITVMIASGDDGSGHHTRQGDNEGKLAPSYPASVPFATAVGATYWANGTSGAETAPTYFGSGGGFSWDFDRERYSDEDFAVLKYLSTVDLPTKYAYSKTGRGTPDVSSLGYNVEVGISSGYGCLAGTSASSPMFAGIMTLLNKVCLATPNRRVLGSVNQLFYQQPQMFNDVTLGTNAIDQPEGWAATKGWDAATGLGTPNFPKMVDAVRVACNSCAGK